MSISCPCFLHSVDHISWQWMEGWFPKENLWYSYQKRKKKGQTLSNLSILANFLFVLFFRSHQSLGNSNGCPSTSSLSLHTHHWIMRSSWHPNYYSVLESPLFIWLVILGSSWRSSFDKALKRKHSSQFTPLAFFLLLTLAEQPCFHMDFYYHFYAEDSQVYGSSCKSPPVMDWIVSLPKFKYWSPDP